MTRQSAARSVTVRSVSSGTILGERPFVQRNALNASGPAASRIANGCAYFGPLAEVVALKDIREFALFRNSEKTNVRHVGLLFRLAIILCCLLSDVRARAVIFVSRLG